jgi:hypothetical protein
MKKSPSKIAKLALATTILAVFLYSCANPVSDNSLPNVSGSAKALVASPLPIYDANYKGVLNLTNSTLGVASQSIGSYEGGLPKQMQTSDGVVKITKLWYEGENGTLMETGTIVVGFDFVSTATVYAVYVKGGSGKSDDGAAKGFLYDFTPEGVTSGTMLHTPANSNGKFAAISHTDFAWKTAVSPPSNDKTITGFVFHDVDKDGVRDSGEAGLGNVTVTLSNGATVTTASDGSYSFSELFAQPYTVSSDTVEGYYRTTPSSLTETASAQNVNFGFTYETISGFVFYDANNNGARDFGEPALSNVNVTLDKDGTPVSVASGSDGSYSFAYLLPENYQVTVADLEGFVHSSPAVQNPLATAANVDFGFFIDYSWLNGKTANGFTIGYWKNNVDKAIANKTNGIQVSKDSLLGYLGTLSNFALSTFNFPATDDGMKQASGVLSQTGSKPTDLLAKQLVGSEFNYASGAYIGGNALATYYFLYQGEYMHLNAFSFTSAELLAQKDLYDAYNNSHGGAVLF